MQQQSEVYRSDDAFNALVDALASVRPTFEQPCVRSAVMEILGEIGNIWPLSVLDDPLRGYQMQRANHQAA